ncbi:MAG: hypothetical protein HY043_14130 [Verrucomicrobia bacterium]|nr:hypothetical protein [Verrucomicrobiota bacterium]
MRQLLVVGALVMSIGAHWAALQSVAWVGMVISYSQNSTLTEAVQKTFDGQHPCKLCKFVSEGKKSEHKQTVVKTETKLDFFFASCGPILFPPIAPAPNFASPRLVSARNASPPTPPPKHLLG